MAWSDLLSVLNAHLVTAGATLTPAITYVRRGEPVSIPVDTIAYWYDGDQESSTGGNTFTKVNVGERITITVYFRVGDHKDSYDANLDERIRAANRAIQARLWGDTHIGENCIGLAIENTRTAWVQYDVGPPERWAKTLTIPIAVDMAETESISA